MQAWKRWQEEYADLSDHCSTTALLLSSEPTPFLEIFRGLSQSGNELENLSLRFRHHSSLKALWLNLNITCPDPSTLSLLKTCDYSTVYTKTHHWRKVRAAMLLINNAHCADCIGSESHYGGGESDIWVRHLTYANRGHEGYEDLRLLCRQHHQQSRQTSY